MVRKGYLALLVSGLIVSGVLCPRTVHASGSLGGITFPTGTNGCTGTLVGVYGDSTAQQYILGEARDYCASFPLSQRASAPDVEYVAGASCPGLTYAATSSDANEIGVSTAFPYSCYNDGAIPVDPSTLADTMLGVNVVEAIATCPGAYQPNGGAVYPWGYPRAVDSVPTRARREQ